jgi:hypothetical protein
LSASVLQPLIALRRVAQTEVYDRGNVSLWVKDEFLPRTRRHMARPRRWKGSWGTPIGSSIIALLLM